MLVNRSLVAYDDKGELRGELAKSWSIDGDGAWVFKLRQDAIFHNGEPVTADDVKWSIEQIAAEKSTAFMRTQFQNVTRIEMPDPQTVRLVTKEPLAVVPTWFAQLQHLHHLAEIGGERACRLRAVPHRRSGARHLDRSRSLRQVLQARAFRS